jgi:hypothetical protein
MQLVLTSGFLRCDIHALEWPLSKVMRRKSARHKDSHKQLPQHYQSLKSLFNNIRLVRIALEKNEKKRASGAVSY